MSNYTCFKLKCELREHWGKIIHYLYNYHSSMHKFSSENIWKVVLKRFEDELSPEEIQLMSEWIKFERNERIPFGGGDPKYNRFEKEGIFPCNNLYIWQFSCVIINYHSEIEFFVNKLLPIISSKIIECKKHYANDSIDSDQYNNENPIEQDGEAHALSYDFVNKIWFIDEDIDTQNI